LDKKPGVHPIGIGDAPRRILAKAILSIVGNEIQLAAGALQTCAEQDAGSEAAIHAMRNLFEKENTEAIILVDADNALTELVVKLLSITLTSYVHHLAIIYRILMVYPSDYLSLVKENFLPPRVPHKGTLLPWLCMPWQ